jgi:arylesterase/paraoxonase
MGVGGFLVRVSIFALIAAALVQILLHNDYFKHTYNHQPGPCRLIKPVVDGSEDLELLPNGFAVITSGLRYLKSVETDNFVGKLFLYNFNVNSTEPKADEIKLIWNAASIKTFNPHGLKSLINDKEIVLYVISHPPGGDVIELFSLDIQKKEAKHLKSLKHEMITAANNLAIVGPEEFYVSNDHYFQNHYLVQLEYLLPYIRLGNVAHYNKGKVNVVDHFLHTPNGMTIDKKRKNLFVASPLDRTLTVYSINSDKTITKKTKVQVDTALDNLFLDEENFSIWTGSHPVLHRLMSYIRLPKSFKAPSHVVHFQFKNANYDQIVAINDPYMNDGSVLSASSSVVKYKNQILVGSVHSKLLICDITNE